MYNLAKRTLIGTISLMVLPVLVWITKWQWQPTVSGWWLKPLFWMTETVSAPSGNPDQRGVVSLVFMVVASRYPPGFDTDNTIACQRGAGARWQIGDEKLDPGGPAICGLAGAGASGR